jgi:hypothetical protein
MRCSECSTNVVSGKRFCNNCGRDFYAEDAVVRIIEEGPVAYNGGELQRGFQYVAATRATKRKLSKKKIVVFSSLLAALIIIFAATNLFKSLNKKEYKYDGEFVLMAKEDEGKRSLYLGIPGEEEVKLASDVAEVSYYNYIKTGNNSRKVLYVTRDNKLYESDGKGNKDIVASRVSGGYPSMSPDLTKYLFSVGDKSTLYLKEKGKDKVKIHNNVLNSTFLQDNETIIFLNYTSELYIREKSGEVDEIAEDVNYIYVVDSFGGIAYVDNEGCTYYINTKTGEKKKLTDSPEDRAAGLDDRGNLYYNKAGDLYVLKNGKQSAKVASDVVECRVLGEIVVYMDSEGKWHSKADGSTKSSPLPDIEGPNYIHYSEGYIIYTDKNNTLFRIKFGNEDKQEIYENVTTVYYVGNDVYFTISDGSQVLYKLEKDGSASKLHEEVVFIQPVDDSYLAYLTADKELYVDGEKYSDVIGFEVGGRNICYISSDGELYLIEDKSNPKKISEDVGGYTTIYFGGSHLFEFKRLITNQ